MLFRACWAAVSAMLFASCTGLPGVDGAAPQDAQMTLQGPVAFPGALGWAAKTIGGRGGQILRVTNLNADGPGSFRAAVEARGPRIVVFEVGGVIDLGAK